MGVRSTQGNRKSRGNPKSQLFFPHFLLLLIQFLDQFWINFWIRLATKNLYSAWKKTMNLLCLFFFCVGLLNSQVFSAPGLSSPENDANNDDFADHQDTVVCGELSDTCAGCLTLESCKFATFNNSETLCVDLNLTEEAIRNLKPNVTLEDVHLLEDSCPKTDDKTKTVPPKFDTSLTPKEDTTTTTLTPGTTTPPTPSSSSTSTITTTATSTTTVTSTTSSSTTTKTTAKPTTPVTTSSTTTTTAEPTTTSTETPVDPSGRGGSKFDGWSFFGGILLTIGLSAIGFVSFKYYKVRSGGAHVGTNYNRF